MGLFGNKKSEAPIVATLNGITFGGCGSFDLLPLGLDALLSVPEAKRCLDRLTNGVAQLPLVVYKETEKGREKAKASPFYALMHDRPNPWMTASTFKSALMFNLIRYGSAYIKRLGKEWSEGLLPVPAPSVEVVLSGPTRRFKVGKEELNDDQMLHILGTTKDGLTGFPIIGDAQQIFDLARTLETYSVKFFKNGANSTQALTSTANVNQDDFKRQKALIDSLKGEKNANSLIPLLPGFDLKKIGVDAKDSQLIEARDFTDKQIRKVFGFPETEKQDLESQAIEFLTFTLEPWLVRIEQAFNLILPPGHFCEFTRDAILRAKALERWQVHMIQRQASALSINEIRQQEGRGQIAGGDDPFVPLSSNMKTETKKQGGSE